MIIAEPNIIEPKRSPPRMGWVHFCNGLDPRRDGGMVPSILGMTGALAEQEGRVTIVTPTPSRLDALTVPLHVDLIGPETDLEPRVKSAEVLHLHGLWQSHTRRGARTLRGGSASLISSPLTAWRTLGRCGTKGSKRKFI